LAGSDSDRPKEQRAAADATKKAGDSRIDELLSYFAEKFKAKRGVPYNVMRGKDGRLMKEALGTYDVEMLKGAVDLFFTIDDRWIKTTDHSVNAFSHKLSFLAGKLSEQKGKAEQQQRPETPNERYLREQYENGLRNKQRSEDAERILTEMFEGSGQKQHWHTTNHTYTADARALVIDALKHGASSLDCLHIIDRLWREVKGQPDRLQHYDPLVIFSPPTFARLLRALHEHKPLLDALRLPTEPDSKPRILKAVS